MVQQRIPLAGSAVSGHGAAFAGRGEQEAEQVALDLEHRGCEAFVTGHRVQARGLLRGQHRLDPLGRLAVAFFRACVDPQRPAVRREFLDIHHPQPGRREGAGGGQQRQVREVLVVDRVVLPALDQAEQVREFERNRALVLDQCAKPGREALDIRYVGEDIVRRHEVGPAVPLGDFQTAFGAQEPYLGPDAPGPGRLGHVRGRLDTEHRNARRLEVLEQIAVVAGYFGDEAVRGQPQALDHRICVALRVLHPRVRVRGKVGVIGENTLARHVRGKLHEQACLAQADVQRIEGFGFVERHLGNVALTKRRHPEIDEGTCELRAA